MIKKYYPLIIRLSILMLFLITLILNNTINFQPVYRKILFTLEILFILILPISLIKTITISKIKYIIICSCIIVVLLGMYTIKVVWSI